MVINNKTAKTVLVNPWDFQAILVLCLHMNR